MLASIRIFADETGIFGLNMFRRERSRPEIIFWSVLVVAFAGYTAKSIVDLSVKFVAEETITSVYQKSRDVIYFPDPLICLYGVPSVLSINSRDTPVKPILEEFVQNFDLNASNFLYSVNFVRDLYKLELSAIPQAHAADAASMKSALERIPDVVPILDTIASSSTLNLLTNLSDFVFLQLCNAMQVSFISKNNSYTSAPNLLACRRENIFIPSDATTRAIGSICVKLDRNKFVFGTGDDRVDIEFRFNATTLRESVGLDEASTNIYFVCDGHYHISGGAITDYDSILEILAHSRRRYYVRLTAVYDNLNLRRRRCDADRDRSARCKGECESRFFYDSYGCWRSIFVGQQGENLATMRRCEAIDYLKNLSFVDHDSALVAALLECRSGCFEPCSKPLLTTNSDSSQPSEITVAKIFVQSHIYTHVDERLANDFESFLSNLGGVLGLWLGASFASVIHIPIFIIRAMIHWFWSRKVGQKAAVSVEMVESSAVSEKQRANQRLDVHDKILVELRAQMSEVISRLRALES